MTQNAPEPTRDGVARAVSAWDRWAGRVGGRDDAWRYLHAARVRAGHRVLEIGAGTGEQTLTLRRTVGASGHVLATDLSEQVLATARRRLRPEGLHNVTLRVADADELDLDDCFDAAVSGFTWMLLSDPVGAAARVRRLLQPEGRFAASVWGPPSEVLMASVARNAALRQMDLGLPTGSRTTPDLSDAMTFRAVLLDAGFEDVRVERFTVTLTWESPEAYAAWTRDVLVDLSDLIARHAAGRSDEVYAAITDAARPHATSEGRLALENTALMGSGRRPT